MELTVEDFQDINHLGSKSGRASFEAQLVAEITRTLRDQYPDLARETSQNEQQDEQP
jgi:hypothetical protein